MNKINFLLIALVLASVITGCTFNQAGYIHHLKEDKKTTKSALIKDHIEIRLINEYNEVFSLEDVIVNYGKTPFNVLDETHSETIVVSDVDFNNENIEYSQNGLQKNFLGIEYAVYTDEALLALLAKQYNMDIIIFDTKSNIQYQIDFKTSKVVLSKKTRHNIYNGFLDTSKYYEARGRDK